MEERKYWNKKIETIQHDELRKLETQALKHQLAYVYENSLFYRKKFDDWGVKPADLESLDDLKRFPYTTKDELRATQEAFGLLGGHQCAPMRDVVRIQGTSGTTGRPLFIGLTRNDINLWNELFARHAWTGGLRPADVMINPANFTLFVGGLTECSGAEFLGITVIPAPFVSTGTDKFMMLIQTFKPTVLFSTPSATVPRWVSPPLCKVNERFFVPRSVFLTSTNTDCPPNSFSSSSVRTASSISRLEAGTWHSNRPKRGKTTKREGSGTPFCGTWKRDDSASGVTKDWTESPSTTKSIEPHWALRSLRINATVYPIPPGGDSGTSHFSSLLGSWDRTHNS